MLLLILEKYQVAAQTGVPGWMVVGTRVARLAMLLAVTRRAASRGAWRRTARGRGRGPRGGPDHTAAGDCS